jgi:hypothetical protein
MSRKRKTRQPRSNQSAQPSSTVPWYRSNWFIIAGVASALAFVLVSGPDALRNSRILPSEVATTISAFRSWVKEDSEWTGKWTAQPEGYADIEDMQLSDVDLEIFIWATEGQIDGTIATKRLCKEIPLFNYVLLEGTVTGDLAHVTAWDLIGGHRVEFAQLTLDRNGYMMTVTPNAGHTDWFPMKALIARDPSAPEDREELNPDHTFCAAEKAEFFRKMRGQKQ